MRLVHYLQQYYPPGPAGRLEFAEKVAKESGVGCSLHTISVTAAGHVPRPETCRGIVAASGEMVTLRDIYGEAAIRAREAGDADSAA